MGYAFLCAVKGQILFAHTMQRGERDPRHLEKTARMRAGLAAEMKRVRAEGDDSAWQAGQPTDTPFGKVQLQNGDGRAAAAPPPALQPAARS